MSVQLEVWLIHCARGLLRNQDYSESGGNCMSRLRMFFFSTLLVLMACSAARAVGDVPQINLILENGMVLIYKGADQGFKPGDNLDVVRGGEVVGRLQVLEVYPTFTKAKIIAQEKTIEVFDIVAPAAPGSVLEKKEKPKEEKPKEEKTEKPEKKEKAPKKEKPEKKPEKKEETAKKEEPKEKKQENNFVPVAMPDKFYNLSMGYFYLNQDLGTANVEQPPVIGYGVDYWMRRGAKNAYLVAGYFMASPEIRIGTTGAPVSVKNKFTSFSLSYVMENSKAEKGSKGSFYYGLGAAYRQFELDSDGLLSSLTSTMETDETGIDFHLLLGYRFDKDTEFKGLYSVDEDYYSLSLCFGMR